MYKEYLKVPQAPEYTARILTYEIGDINKCMIYKDRFGKGYDNELRIAFADSLTMLYLLGEQLGLDMSSVRDDGRERFIERQKECEEAAKKS